MVSTRKKILYGLLLYLCFSSVCLESVKTTTAKAEVLIPNRDRDDKPGVSSRFFGLGNILGSLFGSNRGSPGNNVFQPAVAVQPPFNLQNGWNPNMQDQGRYPNQGAYPNDNQRRYPNQGRFQNFDQGPNQDQRQFPNQGGFGNGQNQGQNFYPQQGQGQFPIQEGFGSGQTQGQNIDQQQYPENQSQGQEQSSNQSGDFVNTDDLPNQVNLHDHDTIYGPEQWENQNQSQDQGIVEQTPEQSQFGNQNPINQGQWRNQRPTQMQNQGAQRPAPQRPNWLDIGQGNYPRPGFNNEDNNNPSQNFGNQGTQTNDFSPASFDSNGQNGQGIENFPSAVIEESANNNGSTASGSNLNNSANDSLSSTTANPILMQCVQDCSSTSEYNPVCGSNNVTYFNGGKLKCAQDCGIDLYILRRGRCQGDTRRGISGLSRRIRLPLHRHRRRAN